MKSAIFLVLFFCQSLMAEEAPSSFVRDQRQFDWGLSFYGASAIQGPLQNVVNFRLPAFDPYYLFSFSAARTLLRSRYIQLELDLVMAKNLEGSGPWQLNPNFMLRFLRLPWDRFLQSSFAIGNGLSYATGFADLEIADGVRRRLLYFIALEFAFELPGTKHWDLLLRVHHRSGMFGVFGGASGGVNYLGLGLRYLI